MMLLNIKQWDFSKSQPVISFQGKPGFKAKTCDVHPKRSKKTWQTCVDFDDFSKWVDVSPRIFLEGWDDGMTDLLAKLKCAKTQRHIRVTFDRKEQRSLNYPFCGDQTMQVYEKEREIWGNSALLGFVI